MYLYIYWFRKLLAYAGVKIEILWFDSLYKNYDRPYSIKHVRIILKCKILVTDFNNNNFQALGLSNDWNHMRLSSAKMFTM